MSQLSVDFAALPHRHGPRSRAIVGFGIVRNVSHIAWNGLSSVARRLIGREVQDRLDVEVGDEPVGISRTEHERSDIVVAGEPFNRAGEVDEERRA